MHLCIYRLLLLLLLLLLLVLLGLHCLFVALELCYWLGAETDLGWHAGVRKHWCVCWLSVHHLSLTWSASVERHLPDRDTAELLTLLRLFREQFAEVHIEMRARPLWPCKVNVALSMSHELMWRCFDLRNVRIAWC